MIGTLEEDLGHKGEVRGEGKEGRTPLSILVGLATYLYRLGKAKRKESQGMQRDVKGDKGKYDRKSNIA